MPAFDGLNLTWETLEGLVKHNGPLTEPAASRSADTPRTDVPAAIVDYPAWQASDLSSYAGVEAQAAAIADDIAYNTHDIDDGLRAGLARPARSWPTVPFAGRSSREIDARYPGLDAATRRATN